MDVTKLVWNMPICQCGTQHHDDVRMTGEARNAEGGTHNDEDDGYDADIEEAMVRNAEDYEGFVDGPAPYIPHTYLQNAKGKPDAGYTPVTNKANNVPFFPVVQADDDAVTNADDGFVDTHLIPGVNWRAVMAGK
jgi:hypothetical protein